MNWKYYHNPEIENLIYIGLGWLWLSILWQLAANLIANPAVFPSISEILIQAPNMSELALNGLVTLSRFGLSFALSMVLGTGLGLCMASSKLVDANLEFLVEFFRSLPFVLTFPLLMLVFGIQDQTKIYSLICFGIPLVAFSVKASLQSIDPERIDQLHLIQANWWQRFRYFMAMIIYKELVTTARITVSVLFIGTIVLEMFVGTNLGIGQALLQAKNNFDLPRAYSWLIVGGLVSYGLNKVVLYLSDLFSDKF